MTLVFNLIAPFLAQSVVDLGIGNLDIKLVLVMLLAQLIVHVLHAWLVGEWSGWEWAGGTLLTAALWPLADSVLFLPQRRLDESDSGSS